ncbi:tRNA (adenosine(37)-N6)-threonylcarbamoyltransferase complex ATPase subunit type 1 TsaE [Dehalogenimonas sp. THU2]|uniref:tRNA (adenosine(37)-N6)-threonylcarbamoyltransferase complex ATPase subunit type 1 TsaE n=1 Tax=Dehalogenimonas sp. THU2 TaxID=3151121 RepID=UPI003218C2AF
MNSLTINANSPVSTRRIGEAVGKALGSGDVVLLAGPLGAGKTTLTQGLALGLGITESVMSPTFVLMRELKGRLPLYHLDLYRLENLPEISDLGLDDYFYGDGVTVVEWADRAGVLLPEEHLRVDLEYAGNRSRSLCFTARGERYEQLLTGLAARFEAKS